MTDPSRATGSSAPASANHATGSASPPANDPAATRAADAKKAIDTSRQAGVVNPGELSKEVAKTYARDPQAGAALHAAVNEQLSPRDQASLNDHLSQTLGAVAGARAVDRLNTTPQGLTDRQFDQMSKTVRGKAQEMGLGSDVVVQGSRAARTAKPTSDIDLGIRVAPEKFGQFLDTQSKLKAPNPGSALERTRNAAIEQGRIHAGEARLSSTAGAIEKQINKPVDLSVVRRDGPFDQKPTMDVPSARGATVRATKQGALVGAAVDGALTTANALKDGRISGDEARDIVAHSAQGAVVGGSYAVTEQGLVRLGASRLAGAGAAGAVVSAGMSVVENFDGLKHGDSQAIGRVAGDTVVGAGAALSGAAAGAAIGSIVPGVGTAVGAVVGLGVGYLADRAMRAGGVDKLVGNAVASGVDAVKSAAGKVAGWLGW